MRVEAFYQEAIIPEKTENITQGTEFLDGLIPFRCEIVKKESKSIEKIANIKETEINYVLKVSHEVPIIFKEKDKIILFGEEYRIKSPVIEEVPDKFKLRASRSREFYRKYVEYTLFLGY